MFYNIIINPIILLYKWLYLSLFDLTGSYGIALLLMSVITSLVTAPFMRWASKIQKNEKHIQNILKPQIETIKSQSKGAEQHKRITDIYKSYAYHPIMAVRSIAGLAVQIPFLIAAYYMLSNLPDIQGRSFLILKDLSKPDGLLGPVNILPILMTAINLMSACTTATFARKDKIQAAIISFLFLLLLYNAPSALLVFWTCNNLWGLLSNLWTPFAAKHGFKDILLTLKVRTIPQWLSGRSYETYVVTALTATFFIFVPIDIYLRNSGEFWFSLSDIIWMLLFCFATATLLLSALAYLLKGKAKTFFVCMLVGITIGLYVQSYLIKTDFGLLDGNTIEWSKYKVSTMINTITWLFCIILPIFVKKLTKANSFKKIILRFSFAIIIFQIFSTVYLINQTELFNKPQKPDDFYLSTDKMFDLSSNTNIVVFILDAFDTEIFERVMKNNPELETQLNGFTFYPDSVGSMPNTTTAIPQILTNVWYENREPFNEYLEKAWRETVFWKTLKNLNYDIRLFVYSNLVKSENQIDNYISDKRKIASYKGLLKDYYSLTAFRAMPNLLKNFFWIYSGDFNKHITYKAKNNYIIDDVKFYNKLINEKVQAQDIKNCFRLYHLHGAHTPITMDRNINRVPISSVSVDEQAIGALKIVYEYIEQIKKLGIYDKTVVIITADHGYHNTVTGSPLMLVKKLKDNKIQLQTSYNPISFADLHATIISTIYQDPSKFGVPFHVKKETFLGRRQLIFPTNNKDVESVNMPLQEYRVLRGVKNIASWIKTENLYIYSKTNNYDYRLGTLISFAANGNSLNFLGQGWSWIDSTHRWSKGEEVNLKFKIDNIKDNAVLLSFKCIPYLGGGLSHQSVGLNVNGEHITTWNVDKAGIYEALIPSKIIITKKGELNIKMTISHPMSPKELNGAGDPRKLGIAAYELIIADHHTKEPVITEGPKAGYSYEIGDKINFTKNGNFVNYIPNPHSSGWSSPEKSHTWTDGKQAVLSMNVNHSDNKELKLRLKAIPYLANGKLKQQTVNVIVNDSKVAVWNVTKIGWCDAIIPAAVNKDGKLMIRFNISDPTSPKDLGTLGDSRKLGIAAIEMVIIEAQ